MRATTAFNKIVAPLGASVTEVTVEEGTVVLSIRPQRRGLRCVCGWTTTSSYDRSVRRWRHLDALGAKVFLHGEIRRLVCAACGRVVTETWTGLDQALAIPGPSTTSWPGGASEPIAPAWPDSGGATGPP